MKKLIINKQDLIYNINIIKKIIGEKVNIIAVVKANGMGLDLVKYSKFLIENGISKLAVATLEEAIELRNANIKNEIILMSEINIEEELKELILNDITLTIGNLEEKNLIEKIAISLNKKVNVHVKIDTGFARYGFLYNDFANISQAVKSTENICVQAMFTHFSKAVDEKLTNEQFDRFQKCMEIAKENNKNLYFHVCNTSAAFKYENMRLDAVRIGSGFQGRILKEFSNLKLRKIGFLETDISKIQKVPKGHNVSYTNEYKTKKETTVAVIPVGYMDGFNLKKGNDIFTFKNSIISILSQIKKMFKDNSFKIKIRNKNYNVIGRLGMYHSIVDLGDDEIDINKDKAIISVSPIYINSKIRREYI